MPQQAPHCIVVRWITHELNGTGHATTRDDTTRRHVHEYKCNATMSPYRSRSFRHASFLDYQAIFPNIGIHGVVRLSFFLRHSHGPRTGYHIKYTTKKRDETNQKKKSYKHTHTPTFSISESRQVNHCHFCVWRVFLPHMYTLMPTHRQRTCRIALNMFEKGLFSLLYCVNRAHERRTRFVYGSIAHSICSP